MNALMFAQSIQSLSLIQWAILIVAAAGVIGIVLVCLKQFGIAIPQFVANILWIVLCVIVGILAIKFIASMM